MRRRDALRLLAGGAAAAALRPTWSAAATQPDDFFLFIHAGGGWDVTLWADPRKLEMDNAKAGAIIKQTVPVYYITGTIHSTETGAPTALMELGYRLAVDNAIANAVKHGGATRVQLSAVSSRAGVEIAIDDDGVGIPEEERKVVFDRFSRGSTASHSGSGLGLALVAQQAALHGGSIELSDGPLGGLRATLTVSVTAGAAESAGDGANPD